MSLLSPLLVLPAFSFLCSRREADLRFSAPVTRSCLYITSLLSALTVFFTLTLVVFLCMTLPRLGGRIPLPLNMRMSPLPEEVNVNGIAFAGFLRFTLHSLCWGCVLCAVMVIAVVLSGRVGHSLFLYLLFVCTPAVIRTIILSFLLDMPMSGYSISGVTDYQWPLWRLWETVSYTTQPTLPTVGACLLVLLLAAALFAVGGLLFRCRRVENVGEPAAGRRVIRFVICLFIFLLTALACEETSLDVIIWPAAGALVLYCVYLLLTTRRLSSLWRCLPCAAVTAAVTVLCVLGGYRVAEEVILRTPIEADQVEGISVDPLSAASSWCFNFRKTNSFGSASYDRSKQFEIREPDVIDEAAALFNRDRLSRLSGSRTKDTDDGTYNVRVTFYMKNGRRVLREINMPKKEWTDFCNDLGKASYDLYRDLLITLPQDRRASGHVSIGYRSVEQASGQGYVELSLTDAQLEFAFRREFERLDEDTKRQLILPIDKIRDDGIAESVDMGTLLKPQGENGMRDMYVFLTYRNDNGGIYHLCFTLDRQLMPDTYRFVCEQVPETEDFMAGKLICYDVQRAYINRRNDSSGPVLRY